MLEVPDEILNELPARVDRRDGAALITKLHFPISPRTLERWDVEWQLINGKALAETKKLLAKAQRMAAEAPRIRGGR